MTEVENKTVLLIVGKAGSGKSSVANSILGKNEFTPAHSFNSHNTECIVKNNTQTLVVRAPDLVHKKFLGEKFDEDKEVKSWLAKTTREPDAVLLVMRCEKRFTREDYELYKQLRNNQFLKELMTDKLVIVFTMGDRLYGRDLRLDLESDDPYLEQVQEIWKDAKKRYVVFDNTASQLSKTTQVCTLMKVVETKEPHPFPQHVCRLLILGKQPTLESSVEGVEENKMYRSKTGDLAFWHVDIDGLQVEITFVIVKVDDRHPVSTESPNQTVKVDDRHPESTESPNQTVKVDDRHPESTESPNQTVKVDDRHPESTESPNQTVKVDDRHPESTESPNQAVKVDDKHPESTESPNQTVKVDDSHPEYSDSLKHAVKVAISPGPHAIFASHKQKEIVTQLLGSPVGYVEEFHQDVDVDLNGFQKKTLKSFLRNGEFPHTRKGKESKGSFFQNSELTKTATEVNEETICEIENRSFTQRALRKAKKPYDVYVSVKGNKIVKQMT